ncbi:MAG TPA: alpha/beta hydrolase [Planctomycetota bacterium]|nr:alpha/beta hydrolase [Planctomycetota bacterium]
MSGVRRPVPRFRCARTLRVAALALLMLPLACGAPSGTTRTVVDTRSGPLDVTRGVLRVAGGALQYEEAGHGAPVVLLHGGQLDSRMWDAQFGVLAAHYRTIRYDARGYGHSSPPAGAYSHAADLLALLDQLDVQRANLVGLSLGGRIAVDFALAHPERVASLVLAGPGLSGWDWSDESRDPALQQTIASGDRARIAAAWLAGPYMAPAMSHADLAPRLRELAADNAGSFLQPERETPLQPPAAGRLGELHGPVLLIVGSRDVKDIQDIVERLAAKVQGARVATFDGAGHMVNMEQPDAFNHEVLGFLAEVTR